MTRSDQPCATLPSSTECRPLMTFTGGNDIQVTQSEMYDCQCSSLIRFEHDWYNGQLVPTNFMIGYNYLHDTVSNVAGHGDAIQVVGRAYTSMWGDVEGNVIVNTPNGAGIRIDGAASNNFGAASIQFRNNSIVNRRTHSDSTRESPVVLSGRIDWMRLTRNVLTNDHDDSDCSIHNVAIRGDGFKGEENNVPMDLNLIEGIKTCGTAVPSQYNTHYFKESTAAYGDVINDGPGSTPTRQGNVCDHTQSIDAHSHRCLDGSAINPSWAPLTSADETIGDAQRHRDCLQYVAVTSPSSGSYGAPGFANCDHLDPISVNSDPPTIPCTNTGPYATTNGAYGYFSYTCRPTLGGTPPPTTTTTSSTTSTSTSTTTTSTTSTTTSSTSTTAPPPPGQQCEDAPVMKSFMDVINEHAAAGTGFVAEAQAFRDQLAGLHGAGGRNVLVECPYTHDAGGFFNSPDLTGTSYPNGTILRVRPVWPSPAGPDTWAVRVMYKTQRRITRNSGIQDQDVAATATVVYRKDSLQRAPGDITLFDHGTAGIAADCIYASDLGNQDNVTATKQLYDHTVNDPTRNSVVGFTDYIGFGATLPGQSTTNPQFASYMVAIDQARANVDLAVAIHDMGGQGLFSSTNNVFVTGHSQGGQAAASTAEYWNQLANGTGLHLVASAPLSAPGDLDTAFDVLDEGRTGLGGDPTSNGLGFMALTAYAWSQAYPDLVHPDQLFDPSVPSLAIWDADAIVGLANADVSVKVSLWNSSHTPDQWVTAPSPIGTWPGVSANDRFGALLANGPGADVLANRNNVFALHWGTDPIPLRTPSTASLLDDVNDYASLPGGVQVTDLSYSLLQPDRRISGCGTAPVALAKSMRNEYGSTGLQFQVPGAAHRYCTFWGYCYWTHDANVNLTPWARTWRDSATGAALFGDGLLKSNSLGGSTPASPVRFALGNCDDLFPLTQPGINNTDPCTEVNNASYGSIPHAEIPRPVNATTNPWGATMTGAQAVCTQPGSVVQFRVYGLTDLDNNGSYDESTNAAYGPKTFSATPVQTALKASGAVVGYDHGSYLTSSSASQVMNDVSSFFDQAKAGTVVNQCGRIANPTGDI
jgi:hypothetical protein